MAQLLVRDLDAKLVERLKKQAKFHGVSAEEEHRRILKEALLREQGRKLTLIEYLLSDVGSVDSEEELDLERSNDIETRDIGI